MSQKDNSDPTISSSASLHKDQVSPSLLQAGVILQERYAISKEIGRGAVGIVYLAHDRRLLSRPVVIKVLRESGDPNGNAPSYRRTLQQEMEALARINHPGVVGILDVGIIPDGRAFLVMQYVEGCSLRSEIKSEGMELSRVAHIMEQIGQALSAAHDKGVYHRDLKPENIMLQRVAGGEELVRLIDFGIARIKSTQSGTTIQSNELAGTPLYMAPEQFEGRADATSDVYAMGLIAYEMCTGRRAFNPASVYQLMPLQQAGPKIKPKDLRPELPDAAQRIILKALSYQPEQRYSSARDLGGDLARALTDLKSLNRRPLETEPKLGKLVSKMCNRRVQEDAFKHSFIKHSATHPAVPQIYIIHGEEGECHESLVERLIYWLELYAAEKHGPLTGTIKTKKIPWQYDDTLESRKIHLLSWLFEAFAPSCEPTPDDLSAFAFKRLITHSLDAFVVIQNEIRAARWDRDCKELLTQYIKYWEEFKGSSFSPQIIIFIDLIYPSLHRESMSRFWKSAKSLHLARRKKLIQKELTELARMSSCPCLVFNELGPISWDDVMEWFSLYNIYDSEEIRLKRSERIFKSGSQVSERKSMAEIELCLRDIHHEFIAQRGYL